MNSCPACGLETLPDALACANCGTPVPGIAAGGAKAKAKPRAKIPDTRRDDGLLEQTRKATEGEYEVHGEVGRGGMAAVYLARDLALDRKVAIKVLLPSLAHTGEEVVERFRREARTAAAMSHPNIIPIYAVKHHLGLTHFVMKFVKGRSLESVLRDENRLSLAVTQTILAQVGSALDYAHRHGVIHRDVKPGNIMLDEDGWAMVMDFGIAKAATSKTGLTITGAAMGTPSYMSPEQFAALELTPASDQYALGVVTYQMLGGTLPFVGESPMVVMYQHVYEPPPPLTDRVPDCPPQVAAAVARMMAKAPEDRFPTIGAAIEAIGMVQKKDEPHVRTQMLTLIEKGDNAELLSRFQTPRRTLLKMSSPLTGARRTRAIKVAGILAAPVLAIGAWLVLGPDAGNAGRAGEGDPGAAAPSTSAPVVTAPPAPQIDNAPTPPSNLRGSAQGEVDAPAGGRGTPVNDPSATTSGRAATSTSPPPPPPPAPVVSSAPVVAAVAAVDLSPETLVIQVGQNASLVARALSTDGSPLSGRTVRWSVAGSAARVTGDGRVEGMSPGQATVTATVEGESASSVITVTAPNTGAAQPPAASVPAPPTRPTVAAPDPEADRAQILGILERYRRSIETEDVPALRDAYPGINADQLRAWQSFFQIASQIRMDVSPADVRLTGDQAVVRVVGTQRFRTSTDQQQPLAFTATFQRTGTGWRLVLVQ